MSIEYQTIVSKCPSCQGELKVRIEMYDGLIAGIKIKHGLTEAEREEKIQKLRDEVLEGLKSIVNMEIER